jgi:hypothetical protein
VNAEIIFLLCTMIFYSWPTNRCYFRESRHYFSCFSILFLFYYVVNYARASVKNL